jgi:hypothetical protein
VRRTRKCFNEHTFYTFEVPPGAVSWKDVRPDADRAKKAYERRRFVLRNINLSATELAKRLGITEARVRQIKQDVRS